MLNPEPTFFERQLVSAIVGANRMMLQGEMDEHVQLLREYVKHQRSFTVGPGDIITVLSPVIRTDGQTFTCHQRARIDLLQGAIIAETDFEQPDYEPRGDFGAEKERNEEPTEAQLESLADPRNRPLTPMENFQVKLEAKG